MSNIVIALDVTASRKNGFIVLKTYHAKNVVVNKNGRYKGSSISSMSPIECNGVKNIDYDFVKGFFSTHCFQLSYNAFLINAYDLVKLHQEVVGNNVFFLDNPDRSLVLINNIKVEGLIKENYGWEKTNKNALLCNSKGCISINCLGNWSKVINREKPLSYLCYDSSSKVYTLIFDYGGERVRYSDKSFSVSIGEKIYPRNYKFECETARLIEEKFFTKLTMGRFLYSGYLSNVELKEKLAENEVFIDEDENIIVPKINLRRSGDSGWFEIGLECIVNGELIDLASKMDLFSRQDSINIEKKIITLPSSIKDVKDDLVWDGRNVKLKINRNNMLRLLHIIYASGGNASDYFPIKNIKLKLSKFIINKAYPYQLEGVKWLKFLFLNDFGGCLADDMGLGKTFQVVAFLGDAEVKKKIKRVLIVSPKSLLSNWIKEFEKFHSSYNIGIYHGSDRRQFKFECYDIIVTTYNTALLDKEVLNGMGFSVMILDEIQMIKNHSSSTSDAIKDIKASIKFGLSGTPMENGISELWNIMDVLNPGMFLSYDAFIRRYSNKNYEELKNILSIFIMRRTKDNVLKELPPKTEEIVYCDMDLNQRKLYAGINIAVKKAISDLKVFSAPIVLKGLTMLRECCCHPSLLTKEINVNDVGDSCKLDALKLLVENLYTSGHKMLIFSGWVSMLQIIKKELSKSIEYKNCIYYLDGSTKNRSEEVAKFEASEKGIFLISIKAGGVGLNLVSAQDVIIYDPWWNPFVEQQAVDRAHRIGQNKRVNVYKLVAANTIEERIVDIEDTKRQNFDELINGISRDKNIGLSKIIEFL